MSDDIIELIDGALSDWTSPDAMRWTPDSAETERSGADRGEPRLEFDGVRLGASSSRVVLVPDLNDPSAPTVAEVERGIPLGVVQVELEINTDRYVEAMAAVAEAAAALPWARLESIINAYRSRPLRMARRGYHRRSRRRR